MKYTKKTDYTNQQLQDALLKLMATKPFEKITINNIADTAHVNRSTFYRYYDDKYQLLERIEDDLIEQIDSIRDQVNPLQADHSAELLQTEVNFFNQHFNELQTLLGNNGDRHFETKLTQGFNERFATLTHHQDNAQAMMIRQVIVATSMTVLKFWLFNADQIDGEEVIHSISDILQNGAFSYLRKVTGQGDHA
ncbi:TetR/AcrR family transcriptional regulator [Limosilactobacillus sp.]|uniref:TetR/AcrR family transcriptional regulator n=1 Tax=Limosilactobacillus sp. TaxID=2773925 RepID=UPI0025C534CA|nr:TetR/AcrR family transcriptional regulator [Limosilactobacillus sp.]MCH3922061.1 TetR/AcrR family transcriptional regulator [Limosilactobacillus sp.]MCH3928832.1 TetR/AcrR family transcriptional regulator [Limosilactobacillus sp.]